MFSKRGFLKIKMNLFTCLRKKKLVTTLSDSMVPIINKKKDITNVNYNILILYYN